MKWPKTTALRMVRGATARTAPPTSASDARERARKKNLDEGVRPARASQEVDGEQDGQHGERVRQEQDRVPAELRRERGERARPDPDAECQQLRRDEEDESGG